LGFSKEKSASGRKDKRFRWRGATIDEKSAARRILKIFRRKSFIAAA
jgi:hypothetical protein